MRLLILTCLVICSLAAYTVEAVGTEVLEKSICVSLTAQRLPIKKIKTYVIKEGTMKAVIFITRRGIKICADPQADWVKKAVQTIDRRNMSQTKKLPVTGFPF
uniref:Chemokine interleukin-8-like domain-containing protein n=1 Tax=Moschus moschiferus TaxID=68415 RepID=A0A8C6D2R2_MOSMO